MTKKIKFFLESMSKFEIRNVPRKDGLVEIEITDAIKRIDNILPEYMGKYINIYI